MSGEEIVLSMVSCNLEPPIYNDWTMKNNKEYVKLEKTVDRVLEASSGDESEEAEAEPPPVAVRRKVSFAGCLWSEPGFREGVRQPGFIKAGFRW